ncbi:MAG: magnesium/cobalt transporter CorA [Bacteroidales bacterium]|jgi:magnesium transporter|nr:magnesium/cobalt transporter CorA [Bacteroidales bacterium]
MSKGKYTKKLGLPPGSLIYTGEYPVQDSGVIFASYSNDMLSLPERMSFEKAVKQYSPGNCNWYHVTGIADVELIEKMGKHFSIHPLLLEDILNANHQPKVEEVDGQLFITLKLLSYSGKLGLQAEHISFILGKDYLLSFREKQGGLADMITSRLEKNSGRIRSLSADYLLYVLVDSLVDQFFVLIEELDDSVGKIESDLLYEKAKIRAGQILRLKRDFILVRRHFLPLRDEFRKLIAGGSPLLSKESMIYFNDVYDHLQQITQTLDMFREQFLGIMDLYIANNDLRMNIVMKRLSVVSTIFLPLTFLVGVYGMNFRHMPELEWQYGYLALWTLLITTAGGLAWYLRRKM